MKFNRGSNAVVFRRRSLSFPNPASLRIAALGIGAPALAFVLFLLSGCSGHHSPDSGWSQYESAIQGWVKWSRYWLAGRAFDFQLSERDASGDLRMAYHGVFGVCDEFHSFQRREVDDKEFRGSRICVANRLYSGTLSAANNDPRRMMIYDCFRTDENGPRPRRLSYIMAVNNKAGAAFELPCVSPPNEKTLSDLFRVEAAGESSGARVEFALIPLAECEDTVTLGFAFRKVRRVTVCLQRQEEYWVPIQIKWEFQGGGDSGAELMVECTDFHGAVPCPGTIRFYEGDSPPGPRPDTRQKHQTGSWWTEIRIVEKPMSRSELKSLCFFEAYGVQSPFGKPRSRWLNGAIILAAVGVVGGIGFGLRNWNRRRPRHRSENR